MRYFRSNPDEEIRAALRTWKVTGSEEDYDRYSRLCLRADVLAICECGEENSVRCERCNKFACRDCATFDVCARCDKTICDYCFAKCDQCGWEEGYCDHCVAPCKWCDSFFCESGGFSKETGEWTHRYIWRGGDNIDGCIDVASHDCPDFPWEE